MHRSRSGVCCLNCWRIQKGKILHFKRGFWAIRRFSSGTSFSSRNHGNLDVGCATEDAGKGRKLLNMKTIWICDCDCLTLFVFPPRFHSEVKSPNRTHIVKFQKCSSEQSIQFPIPLNTSLCISVFSMTNIRFHTCLDGQKNSTHSNIDWRTVFVFLVLHYDARWPIINCFTQDSNGQECTVVLLDSEGIDAVTGEDLNDNQIFTLTVLLASVLIYNSPGVPTRHDLEGLEYPFIPLFLLQRDLWNQNAFCTRCPSIK